MQPLGSGKLELEKIAFIGAKRELAIKNQESSSMINLAGKIALVTGASGATRFSVRSADGNVPRYSAQSRGRRYRERLDAETIRSWSADCNPPRLRQSKSHEPI